MGGLFLTQLRLARTQLEARDGSVNRAYTLEKNM